MVRPLLTEEASMSQYDSFPTVILAPKPGKPRRRPTGEPFPWVKVAIGGSIVWMFAVIVLTVYFSLQGGPARRDEQPLNALPGARPVEREQPEKKPVAEAKPAEPEEELDFPLAKDE